MRRNSQPASSMATTKDHGLLHQNSKRNFSLLPLLSLLCFASMFLALSLFRKASIPSHSRGIARFRSDSNAELQSCDFSDGTWIYDPDATPQRYDNTCKEIFKGWNCIASNKSNARELIKWKWKPKQCELHPFDPVRFLEKYRDTSIGFIGDSLNRNMFVSLFCTLKRVTSEVKKWRPAGSDRGFTFLHYNLTIAYHRTNLLARYGRWSANSNGAELESLGYKEGFRVDIDVAEGTWAEAPSFHDILIFNTGHWWWAPSKFDPLKSPMLFFENGHPVIPPLHPHEGLDKVLKHMVTYVEKTARPGTVKFFRTQSPRHFEGGDWDQGGSCQRLQPLLPEQVEELFSLKNNGTNVEARIVNQHLYKALEGSNFHILDITHMSELRADAHPSTAGGKKHDDCMHWCLPGVADTWNDLFIADLNFKSAWFSHWSSLIAQAFLTMFCHLKFGLFIFFVVFVVIMSIFVYFFRLETKGIPIEEMISRWKKHWHWSRFVDNDEDYANGGPEMG